jgi:Spy/CpxP family protein refolding chaperone
MKRKLFTTGLMALGLIFCLNNASAQEGRQRPSMEEMQQKQLEEMKTELLLTDEQTKKITSIMEEQRKAMEAKREENSETQGDDREARMKERKAYDEKIKTVLTPEQQTKYDELQEKRKEERENRRSEE